MAHINLLPPEFRRWLLIRRRLLQWSVVWGLTAAVVASLGCWKVCRSQTQKQRLHVMKRQCEPQRRMAAENTQMQERVKEMAGRESLLRALDSAQYPLQLMGMVSQGVRTCDARVQVRKFSLTQTPNVPARPTTARRPTGTDELPPLPDLMRLQLAGTAVDDLAVARFITSLREDRVCSFLSN